MVLRNRRTATSTVDESNQPKKKRLFSGSFVFVFMIVVAFLCSIEFVSTIRNYALSLAELHALQRDEAALKDKKQELDNNIDRWKDKAYVTAQARDRLGFIFPGEQAVRVEHPEAVTGVVPESFNKDESEYEERKALPWYSDLFYSLHKADKPDDMSIKSQDDDVNDSNKDKTSKHNKMDKSRQQNKHQKNKSSKSTDKKQNNTSRQ